MVDAMLRRLKDITETCKGSASSCVCADLSKLPATFDNDCLSHLRTILGSPDNAGILSRVLDVSIYATSPRAPDSQIVLTQLIASVDTVLIPMLALLNMAAAYWNQLRDIADISGEASMFCSRLYAFLRGRQQRPRIETVEAALEALSEMLKPHLQMLPHENPDTLIRFYRTLSQSPQNIFLESSPEVFLSHICKAWTVLSIAERDGDFWNDCCALLESLSLRNVLSPIKKCFRRMVCEWKSSCGLQAAISSAPAAVEQEPFADTPSYSTGGHSSDNPDSDNSGASNDPVALFIGHMGAFSTAEASRLLNPKQKKNAKTLFSDFISENQYEMALKLVNTTSDHEPLWNEALIAAIPRLWAKINKHQMAFEWSDSVSMSRLKCTLRTIQITFENPFCRNSMLGVASSSFGCCEHGVHIGKFSDDSKCMCCNAQRALQNLLINCCNLIRAHFEQGLHLKHTVIVESRQPLHVQYWFQILALLCSHSEFFYRPRHLNGNMKGIDAVSGKNICFAARKLLELVEVCAIPPISMGSGNDDARDIKSCILRHLENPFPADHPVDRVRSDMTCSASTTRSDATPKLTQVSKDAMTHAILEELGRLSHHSLTPESPHFAQTADLHYILGALLEISRDDSKEADVRSRILRKVRAWNTTSDPRGCSLYCACLCLMMLGRESSSLMFGLNVASMRREKLKRLTELLDSISKQASGDRSNRIVEMYISELIVTICLSSCKDSLLPPVFTLAETDSGSASVTFPHHSPTAAKSSRDPCMPLPEGCSDELGILHQICATPLSARMPLWQRVGLEFHAEGAAHACLEDARQRILNMLTDKVDGQTIEELQVRSSGRVGEGRVNVNEDGWVDQAEFMNAWGKKWDAMQAKKLNSVLDSWNQHHKPVIAALIKAAHAKNKESGGIQRLNSKDDRLKFLHYQALAEQGFLEPGHEKCSWIRGAFDVEALASQMEENALAELRAAIEYVRWCLLGVD
jgi:hypothetical protein